MTHHFASKTFSEFYHKDTNFIIVCADTEVNLFLFEKFDDNRLVNLKQYRKMDLYHINPDGSWPLPDKPLLISARSFIKTIRRIDIEKRAIERLYQHHPKRMILLHALEDSLLINSSVVYPEAIRDDLLSDCASDSKRWKRFFVPKNAFITLPPVSASFRMISDAGNRDREKIFQYLTHCLYPPDGYKQVQRIRNFKKSVFLVKVKPKNKKLASRYEVIKMDSVFKINREMQNFDLVHANLTGAYLYQVLKSATFAGEFIGAVRSCAESASKIAMFRFVPLSEMLKQDIRKANAKKIFSHLQACLESFYQIGQKGRSKNAFKVYRETILPSVMDIAIPWGAMNFGLAEESDEISKIRVNFNQVGPLKDEKIDKLCLRVLEIKPDDNENERCSLIFEAQDRDRDNLEQAVQLRCIYFGMNWREKFINLGISEGSKVTIRNMEAKGYLVQLFEAVERLNMIDDLTRYPAGEREKREPFIDRRKSGQKRYARLERFIRRKKLNDPKLTPWFQTAWNPLYLFDLFSQNNDLLFKEITGPAHGDLNLDNILVYSEESDKNSPCELDENNSSEFSSDKDDQPKMEVRLIDIASFGLNFPLSFDYVKLETEIKNHILAPLFDDCCQKMKTGNEKDQFIDAVLSFEKQLWQIDDNANIEVGCLGKKWREKTNLFLRLIREIRKKGQRRYRMNVEEAQILYQQQLFFYSLRTLTFRTLPKCGKRWALLAAMMAADHLNFIE